MGNHHDYLGAALKTYSISLEDCPDETVEAESFIIERDGWVIFKGADQKAVAVYPSRRIERIKAEPVASHGVSITIGGTTTIL